MSAYCCTNRMKKFCIANILTSDWRGFKGPPWASEWTFGSAGRSTAAKTEVEEEMGQGSMQSKVRKANSSGE